jgi:acetyl esterase/lipase
MLKGLPPLLIQVGDGEVLRDEGIEWGQCIARVGGCARVEVYDGVFHVFHAFHVLREPRKKAFRSVSHWIKYHVDQKINGIPPMLNGVSLKTNAIDVVIRINA